MDSSSMIECVVHGKRESIAQPSQNCEFERSYK